MEETPDWLPLFPLGTVLFPEGVLPIRVFEPRYLRLVGECLRQDQPFGICAIARGQEVGQAAQPRQVGTAARIMEWDQGDDGMLQIVAMGERRFRIRSSKADTDQLLRARFTWLDEPPVEPLPAPYRPLAEALHEMIHHLGRPFSQLHAQYENANWVGARLTELLPIPLVTRQALLEMDDPLERLKVLQRFLQSERLSP